MKIWVIPPTQDTHISCQIIFEWYDERDFFFINKFISSQWKYICQVSISMLIMVIVEKVSVSPVVKTWNKRNYCSSVTG